MGVEGLRWFPRMHNRKGNAQVNGVCTERMGAGEWRWRGCFCIPFSCTYVRYPMLRT